MPVIEPMTIGQIPARLALIEAKLDAIITAMDHASGEPEAGKHTFWRTKPPTCGTCRYFQRDISVTGLGWCHQRRIIMQKDRVPDCNRYEPEEKPDRPDAVDCQTCSHWQQPADTRQPEVVEPKVDHTTADSWKLCDPPAYGYCRERAVLIHVIEAICLCEEYEPTA